MAASPTRAELSRWTLAGGPAFLGAADADYTLTDPADPLRVLYLYRRREAGRTVRRVGATDAVGLPANHSGLVPATLDAEGRELRPARTRPLTAREDEENAAQVALILAAFEAAYNRRAKG